MTLDDKIILRLNRADNLEELRSIKTFILEHKLYMSEQKLKFFSDLYFNHVEQLLVLTHAKLIIAEN